MNLSTAELALTRTDRALCALPTILDPDALLKQLADGSGAPVADKAARHYIRYKPGTNCLVAYSLESEGHATSMYAKAFSSDFDEKRSKAIRGESTCVNGTKQLWVFPNQRLLVRRFQSDGKLTVLKRLADERDRRMFIRRLLPLQPEFWNSTIVELAYKPERRYVCQLQSQTGNNAVLKLYNHTAYCRSVNNSRFLNRIGYKRLPPRMGKLDRHRTIVFRWYPGSSFRDFVGRGDEFTDYAHMVGCELAELHKARPAKSLLRWDPIKELKTIDQLAQTLVFLLPGAKDVIQHVTRRLTARLSTVTVQPQLIHGDFHSKQILLHAGTVRFLDLDELAAGPVEYDLGTFLAHLRRDVLRGYLQPAVADRIASHFLEGYAQKGAAPEDIGLYVALALLKFSHHPFRACEQNWELGIERILRAASSLVDQNNIESAISTMGSTT